MRFLTDENVYFPIVKMLRNINHDVLDIKEEKLFGISDSEIIDIAKKKKNRILITFNRKHFANILLFPPEKTPGIIIINMPKLTIRKTTEIFKEFIKNVREKGLKGILTIVEESRVRKH